uniref:Fibronectin type III domain-containing protein n=1 Tax=Glossina morsitans morsitans TaxID=37546 RepID=A0A1B0F9S2_GLOMM
MSDPLIEWGSGWKGTNFIVEIEETVTVSPISTDYLSSREDATSSEIRNATNIIHVTRMSMGLVNNVNMPTCQFPAYNPTIYSKGFIGHNRPRQNSVFVGPSPNRFLIPRPPRKTRSAMDLHSMVLDESAEQV